MLHSCPVMLLRMDNETRQFSARGASGDAGKPDSQASQSGSTSQSDPQRAQRPKQYIPDPGSPMEQTSLGQPVYDPPQYDPPQYDPQYGSYYESAGRQGSNIAAMVLGILLAIALVSALVLYFLWRSAAAEAEKPPVTVTQTQTDTVTTTTTTTKRPSLFGNRDSDSEPAPQEPGAPAAPTPTRAPAAPTLELPPELQDIVDGILEE